jgi:hypothetical protein
MEDRKKHPIRKIKNYENNIILIQPKFDASDKEIFKRNGMPGYQD